MRTLSHQNRYIEEEAEQLLQTNGLLSFSVTNQITLYLDRQPKHMAANGTHKVNARAAPAINVI